VLNASLHQIGIENGLWAKSTFPEIGSFSNIGKSITQHNAKAFGSASSNLSLKASLTLFKIQTALVNSSAEKKIISPFFGSNLASKSAISFSDINFKIGDFFPHSSLLS
jgi:hypothetical protein